MKIAVHQPRVSYYMGGGEVIPLLQARKLNELGHEVVVVTKKVDEEKKTNLFKKVESEVDVETFLISGNGKKGWNRFDLESLLFGYETQEFYRENDFDLVVTHYSVDSLLIPKRFFQILHLHGVPSERREMDREALKNVDSFISVSKYVKNGWEDLYPEISGHDNPVIYNGIDTEKYSEEDTDKEYDFLFVGRLIRIKGLRLLCKAMKHFEGRSLAIAGKGPEKEWLERFVEENEVNIDILGYVSEERKKRLYSSSKVFMATSFAKEGVLTTMLEAMASGMEIVYSDSCSMKEAFDGEGFVFSSGSLDSLSEKMEEALKEGGNHRKKVIENFEIENQTQKLADYYRRVC